VSILRNIAIVIFVIALPVALVTTTIRFITNEPRVYRYALDEFDGVSRTRIDREQLLRAGAELRAYFNNDQETVAIQVQQDGRETSLFNQRETAHLRDVKDRFITANKAQEFSVLYVLSYVAVVVLWSREVSMRALAVQVMISSSICLAAIGIVGGIGFAGFDSAWENFHEILFSNDFWLLNPATDRLIQMFPPAFWENIVFLMGLLIAAQAALLLLAAGLYVGASRHQASRRLEPTYA
jgi:integral membrane protein (TIGR01906 family)